MPTMTHSKQARKDWHAGKQKDGESKQAAAMRCWKAGNFRGALTSSFVRSGMYYAALPGPERKRKVHS